jgi:hypothetical protein
MRILTGCAVFLLLGTAAAMAGPSANYTNTTVVEGSDGQAYPFLGADFQTTAMAATLSGNTMTLDFDTLYNGSDTADGLPINYGDIFIGNAGSPNYTYAISLGDNTALGGVSAGLYSVGSYLTSSDVFSHLSGLVYGQAYYVNNVAYQSPTILTSGVAQAGDVTSFHSSKGLVVTLKDLSSQEILALTSSFSLYWGTGICGNGGLYIPSVAPVGSPNFVAEPATLGLFAMMSLGVVGLGAMRRQKKEGLLF